MNFSDHDETKVQKSLYFCTSVYSGKQILIVVRIYRVIHLKKENFVPKIENNSEKNFQIHH